MGGRGSGKTRAGAEWVNALARGLAPADFAPCGPIALVGETLGDVREVMVDGPSGILAVCGADRPVWESTRRRLVWRSGMVAQAFSSEDPESLRGPQFAAAWCDELGKWKHGEQCWDMLQFGLRLGSWPRQLVTTTPRPVPALLRILEDKATFRVQIRTADNAGNLAPGFLEAMQARYGRSALGRQEIDGELILDRADALWRRAMFARSSGAKPDDLARIVVAVDPPASARKTADACGIVAAGIDTAGFVHVLADRTVQAVSPTVWAARAIGLYRSVDADALVAEANQGGDMVASVIASVDAGVPVKLVRAKRGKWLRAEPVAALYEQGRVVHAVPLPELEDEMCAFGPDGLADGRSPDRVDALVWAVSELALQPRQQPRVRPLA